MKTTKAASHPVLEPAADLARAVLIACAALMDLSVRSNDNYVNWWVSLPHPWATTLVAAGAFCLLRRARRTLPELGLGSRLLALFLGVWYLFAQCAANTGDVVQPFLTHGQTLKAAVTALGMACVYALLIRGLEALLFTPERPLALARAQALLRLYREHTQAFCAAALLLCWLPRIVCAYPVAMNSDTRSQIDQALGLEPLGAHHPVFGTLLLRLFMRVGEAVLSGGGAGLTLCVLAQALLAAMILGYSQAIMRRLGAPRWLRAGALLLCGIGQAYGGNAAVLLKDVPYSYAFLLLACEFARAAFLREPGYARSAGHLLRCWAAGVFLLLMRNNGVFVFLPVCALLLFGALRARDKRRAAHALAAALPPLLVFLAVSGAVNASPDIRPASLREALSLPFQQTARYVTLHGEDIPQEEREIISGVLPYERIAKLYQPAVSDPIKALCPEDASFEDVAPYLRVWARQFLRDPLTHLQATFLQNALLLDPQTFNIASFAGTGLSQDVMRALRMTRPQALDALSGLIAHIDALLYGMPFYIPLNTVGFYGVLLLIACALALRRRARGLAPLLAALLISMGVIVLGPCLLNQDRYGFPLIYCMPLLLACLRRAAQGSGKAA